MSIQAVMFVLDRLFKDPALFHGYTSDPQGTLAGFDLTAEEAEAVMSGNREQLIAVGVDERVAGWIPWRKSGPHSEHIGGSDSWPR